MTTPKRPVAAASFARGPVSVSPVLYHCLPSPVSPPHPISRSPRHQPVASQPKAAPPVAAACRGRPQSQQAAGEATKEWRPGSCGEVGAPRSDWRMPGQTDPRNPGAFGRFPSRPFVACVVTKTVTAAMALGSGNGGRTMRRPSLTRSSPRRGAVQGKDREVSDAPISGSPHWDRAVIRGSFARRGSRHSAPARAIPAAPSASFPSPRPWPRTRAWPRRMPRRRRGRPVRPSRP